MLCAVDPPMLYDLETDPHEAGEPRPPTPEHAETLERLTAQAMARWDLDAFDADVRESQALVMGCL